MAHLFNTDPVIGEKIDAHKAKAEGIIQSSASHAVKEAFKSRWMELSPDGLSASIGSQRISVDVESIKSTISGWIREFEAYKTEQESSFDDDDSKDAFPVRQKHAEVMSDIDTVIYTYKMIQNDIDDVEEMFTNTTRPYRSPFQQALNDLTQFHNVLNDVEGDFSGFKNVSAYIHGIEDNGDAFLESATKAAEDGDIIVREERDEDKKEYYIVEGGDLQSYSYEKLKNKDAFNDKEGRLHFVYETEYKNEHRQDTSDKLAESLIDMGLLNDETQMDMFGHSYGGRRSLQFAMDYPEQVRSMTTIGTPYDTNLMASAANNVSKDPAGKDLVSIINKYPAENSHYLDFDKSNARTDMDGDYSNAYTDMASVSMADSLDNLETANPEAYKEIEQMDITAVAGRNESTIDPYYSSFSSGSTDIPAAHDWAVSTASQKGNVLGDLVDEQMGVKEEGESTFSPPHSNEIKNEEFIDLMSKVNKEQAE